MSSAAAAAEQRLAYWQHYKYYEGHLFIKVQKSGYEKRWVVLLGNEIHLYTTKIPQRDQGSTMPIQHYPIHPSIAIGVDQDFKMHIKCELWTMRVQATSNEERENWRIRILTISKGEELDHGRLLPGQQELLADITQKETTRKYNQGKPLRSRRGSSPAQMQQFSQQAAMGRKRGSSFSDVQQYTDNSYYRFLPDEIALSQILPPVWFFGKISRNKAEQILHQSTSNGDLLLRESEAHPGQYTLSVRQDTDNKSLIRHYMFKKDPYERGFLLLIEDKPPVLASMYELMWFFIQESGGHLLPLQKDPHLPSPNYDISVPTGTDPSNGEMSAGIRRANFERQSYSMDDAHVSPSLHHHPSFGQEPEDNYLVPDAVPTRSSRSSSVVSMRSPLRSVNESFDEETDTYAPATSEDDMPLREAPLPPGAVGSHTLSPQQPPSHHLEQPTSPSNTSTGYVKMRSYMSSPNAAATAVAAAHTGKLPHGDVGYINMRTHHGAKEGTSYGGGGDDGDGDGGSGTTPTPPPLPRKSRSHHGYCTHLKSVPEEAAETGIPSPVLHHFKTPLRPTNSCPPGNAGELQKAFKRFGLREESSA